MENQLDTKPQGAASDSKAEAELSKFVKENRQQLPSLPGRATFEAPEAPDDFAAVEAAEAKLAEHRRLCEIRGRAAELVGAAGARYRDCTFDNFRCEDKQQVAVVKALREYVASDCSDSVILYGPVGTGKDHLAFAICRHAIKTGKTVRWINGQTWFGMVRDAMDTERPEASLVSALAGPDVLCLSDPLPPIGTLTQHQATMLYRVVDGRYARGVATICTINVADNDEADARLGAATWDRLCHGAWKMRCEWDTFRKPTREV